MERVDAERTKQLVASGATLVEVLPSEDYSQQHIAGAINIPLEEIPQRAEELAMGQPVVVYCNDYQ